MVTQPSTCLRLSDNTAGVITWWRCLPEEFCRNPIVNDQTCLKARRHITRNDALWLVVVSSALDMCGLKYIPVNLMWSALTVNLSSSYWLLLAVLYMYAYHSYLVSCLLLNGMLLSVIHHSYAAIDLYELLLHVPYVTYRSLTQWANVLRWLLESSSMAVRSTSPRVSIETRINW